MEHCKRHGRWVGWLLAAGAQDLGATVVVVDLWVGDEQKDNETR